MNRSYDEVHDQICVTLAQMFGENDQICGGSTAARDAPMVMVRCNRNFRHWHEILESRIAVMAHTDIISARSLGRGVRVQGTYGMHTVFSMYAYLCIGVWQDCLRQKRTFFVLFFKTPGTRRYIEARLGVAPRN